MVTLPPPPQTPLMPSEAEVRPLWHESPDAQGVDGRKLQAVIDEVFDHWEAKASLFQQPSDVGEFEYRHVPFESVGQRRVRYRAASPMKPRTYSLDEDFFE